MRVFDDALSLWQIGLRWAGSDPDKFYLFLPLAAKDNFRWLITEIINEHLRAINISPEKYEYRTEEDPEDPKFYVRFWLKEFYSCMDGRRYSKKLLKFIVITRDDLMDWAQARGYPLPSFWFSEDEIKVFQEEAVSKTIAKHRSSAIDKIACQAVAKTLWDIDPKINISQMTKHPSVLNHAGGKNYVGEYTLRNWISEVAPKSLKNRRGRPKRETQ